MINERQAVFLLEKEMNDNDKYRNYRLVPDKNGISRVYRGGSCGKGTVKNYAQIYLQTLAG